MDDREEGPQATVRRQMKSNLVLAGYSESQAELIIAAAFRGIEIVSAVTQPRE